MYCGLETMNNVLIAEKSSTFATCSQKFSVSDALHFSHKCRVRLEKNAKLTLFIYKTGDEASSGKMREG